MRVDNNDEDNNINGIIRVTMIRVSNLGTDRNWNDNSNADDEDDDNDSTAAAATAMKTMTMIVIIMTLEGSAAITLWL